MFLNITNRQVFLTESRCFCEVGSEMVHWVLCTQMNFGFQICKETINSIQSNDGVVGIQ